MKVENGSVGFGPHLGLANSPTNPGSLQRSTPRNRPARRATSKWCRCGLPELSPALWAGRKLPRSEFLKTSLFSSTSPDARNNCFIFISIPCPLLPGFSLFSCFPGNSDIGPLRLLFKYPRPVVRSPQFRHQRIEPSPTMLLKTQKKLRLGLIPRSLLKQSICAL